MSQVNDSFSLPKKNSTSFFVTTVSNFLRNHVYAIAVINLIAQITICFTGAIVRTTGSGLGCSTWPKCFPDNFTPTFTGEIPWWHQAIEFGNRTIAVLFVTVTAIAVLLAVIASGGSPTAKMLAWCMPLSTVGQAILGGISVLTKLAWWSVMSHMLLSLIIVWLASLLIVQVKHQVKGPENTGEPVISIQKNMRTRQVLLLLIAVLALVIVLGTFTTSAGPLAGDMKVQRLIYPIYKLLTYHTITAAIYCLLLALVTFIAHKQYRQSSIYRLIIILDVLGIVQIGIGVLQSVLGIPPFVVIFHVLGATLNVSVLAMIWGHCTFRPRVQ